MSYVQKSGLGKKTRYVDQYDPSILFPIPREEKRREMGIPAQLPFSGKDIWYGYELSWLNQKGKPEVVIAIFEFPCDSHSIVESKSFKLYLNSFNQTHFPSRENVREVLARDLSHACGNLVQVEFINRLPQDEFSGICLDSLDIATDIYQVTPSLLKCRDEIVQESLFSHLLKSNCLVTGQPDWATLYIHYKGPQIDHSSLLKYIISYRQHLEFHEQCIERIFTDLLRKCRCEKLTVFGKFTRRGGLDINPFRSNFEEPFAHFQTSRQ